MTPEQTANQNIALMITIAAAVIAVGWCGLWLLSSDHPITVWFRIIMLRLRIIGDDDQPGVEQVWHQAIDAVSASATPNTDDTEPVSGVQSAAPIDTSARDIIRASLIAELLDSGLLTNRDKAICQVWKCSKAASTRPGAPFQVALRLVEQHRAKSRPEYRVLDDERRPVELRSADQRERGPERA